MATKTASPKTRKPKVNNFVLALEQFLEKHNLMADSIPEQLNEHAPKLDILLPDWMARRCVKVALAREEREKYCAKISNAMDIFTHHLDLGPKNDYENEIVTSGSCQSQFRVKLAEGGVSPKIINTYAKDPKLIQESNKIQKKQTKKRMANPDRIPIHFSSARVLKRIQNMDISKIPSKEDLADVIVMLSMRLAEVRSLQIIHYKLDHLNAPVWYKEGYSWYCTGYLKSRGEKKKNPEPRLFLSMEKSPECARELLTWIQNAIKAKKLRDPVFTENEIHNAWLFNEFLKQEPYRTIPKKLKDYGSKHASRIHGGKKPTPQHLKLLLKIAIRQESDRLDAGNNYAIGNTKSEESDSEPETSDSSKPQIQASSSSQTIEMDSMLAEIDTMLAEIQN
ncbi:26375_t:CDS:2 [Dentiscutata erythropus]|uniref:26375_t:CDS:1 n=1 Tax=Dentiscutata erythropus TaxID=1348616 RepID=A0A9N9BX74_9GLOM|nr:26375_t:CDS:2 [Dentiscutata erythropus]